MRDLVLAAILAASPAVADDMPERGVPFSLDMHSRSGAVALDAVVMAEPYGSGWRVTLTCQRHDPATGRLLGEQAWTGVAVMAGRWIRGLLHGGTFTVYAPLDEPAAFASSLEDCASGRANIGTGD